MREEAHAEQLEQAGQQTLPFAHRVLRATDLNADTGDGPLPLFLVSLTIVTGLVDAISFLSLGRVFVANMTGNVVFLGFSAGGTPGFSVLGSVLAMAAFLLGAFFGGRAHLALKFHRGHILALTIYSEAILVAGALGCSLMTPVTDGSPSQWPIIFLLGLSMGLQNSTARRLNVRDLTTTVLTMTLTGLASDARGGGKALPHPGRRYTAIGAMFLGALLGTLVIRHMGVSTVLAIVLAVLLANCIASVRLWSGGEGWALPSR
jgi:uncharacterized membrane protein YoaK (UPF0700 family)